MAIVAVWYESIVALKDKGGNVTTRTWRLREMDTAGDINDLIDAQNALIVDLDAVTECVVLSIRLARVSVNDAFALPTDLNAEVENNARISAKITGFPNKSATIDIPGPIAAMFQGTTGKAWNQVNMANAALVAFLDNFTGSTPPYLVDDGETITQTDDVGKRVHKRSTKG